MEETKKAVEIKDEELDQVTGGGCKRSAKLFKDGSDKLGGKKRTEKKEGIGLINGEKADVCRR